MLLKLSIINLFAFSLHTSFYLIRLCAHKMKWDAENNRVSSTDESVIKYEASIIDEIVRLNLEL